MKTHDLTKMAICITLLCISSYVSFPLPLSPVMITTQTIIINLIALILTPKQAFVTVIYHNGVDWLACFFRRGFRSC